MKTRQSQYGNKLFCILLLPLFILLPSSLSAESIGIIGTATYIGDWITDVDMNQDPGNSDLWTLQMTLSDGEVKFRQDDSWSVNWGGNDFPSGIGIPDGQNIPVAPGNYLVSFNTNTLAYSFSILSDGNTGIGTFHPQERLDVNGNVKFSGELMPDGVAGADGQVLQSTGDGNMQWADRSAMQGSVGFGTWGDCEMNKISEYFPVNDTGGKVGDYLGNSVTVSGEYAAVGSPGDDSTGTDMGSVIVYHYDAGLGQWLIDGPKIYNPEAQSLDHFGCSVSMSFPYLIVGAWGDDTTGAGDYGSASVFKKNMSNGIWELQGEKLLNPDGQNNDRFGFSVDISEEYAIVGAFGDSEDLLIQGSATIFKRNPITGYWEQDGLKLVDPEPNQEAWFGHSVGISGEYAITGAPRDDGLGGFNRGAICFFKKDSVTGQWGLFGDKIFNENKEDNEYFGYSVDISNNLAIVGAPMETQGTGRWHGTVSIYKLDLISGYWEMQFPKMTNQDAVTEEKFGYSVSISGDYTLVGACLEDGYGGSNQGSATLFRRVGNNWQKYQKIFDPGSWDGDELGTAVDHDASTQRFIIGAPGAWNDRGKVVFGKY